MKPARKIAAASGSIALAGTAVDLKYSGAYPDTVELGETIGAREFTDTIQKREFTDIMFKRAA